VVPRTLDGLAEYLQIDCPPEHADLAVTGVSHASGSVLPGDLYVAIPGQRAHGAAFAGDAAAAGALALLTDPAGATLAADTALPTLVADDPRALLGQAAAYVYGFPARDVRVVGVTGTNGKTTVTSLLHSVLTHVYGAAGLVGTIETRLGQRVVPSVRTTPEASDLHAILAVLREQGIGTCAIEVSSHALALGRVAGLVVDVAGFTNLSQDHQDFHPDMEHYFATKASLFTPQRSRRGVVMVDDAWGRRLAQQAGVPVQTVAVVPDDPEHPAVRGADWTVQQIRPEGGGSRAELLDPDGVRHDLVVPLPGLVNVANAALTVALAAQIGVAVAAAVQAVASAPMVPGRMELVSGERRPVVVVDYAHSPDALDTALATLRAGSPRPLVVVVGAGGDRDTGKRGPMGAAAAHGADHVIVTDDNPRSEDPATIRAAVLAGARSVQAADVREVADRAEAIEQAVLLAGTGTVLLAGKGHEQGQQVGDVVHPFDDRVVAREVLDRVSRQEDRP
jgi:UDP-N-acetylmuramoyl-L-alanyl-D-glutamate--2,6-diaminopimelate ligase